MIPAVIYARYSSSNQREESIDGQLRECHQYAERNGFTIVKEYTDAAISGRSDARPSFQKMIKDSESHAFQALIVWKLDRFARNRYDSAMYRNILKKNGVKIYSVMENISDGPEGIILEGLMESLAEYYSANLSENIKRGCYDAALHHRAFGRPPLGLKKAADGTYEIDPVTAPIVRRIFEEYTAGRSLMEICNGLNADGIRTAKGGEFTGNSFHHILSNEKYIGIYDFEGIRDENAIPPIISRDLWDRAQAMRKRVIQRKRNQHDETSAEPYLLATKLFCGHCGETMTGESARSSTGTIFRYYSCNGTKSRRRNGCKKKRVRKEWIESEVIRILMEEILTEEMIEYLADEFIKSQHDNHEAVEIRSQEAQLADVNRKIANINRSIAEGIWASSTAEMLRDLESTRDALQESIAALRVRPPEISRETIVAYLHSVKSGAEYNLRDTLIDLFIRRIYLRDDDDGKNMRALFELSIDGGNGEPVKREYIIEKFEHALHSSTFCNINELEIIGTSALIMVRLQTKKPRNDPRFSFAFG